MDKHNNDRPLNGIFLNDRFYEAIDLTEEEVEALPDPDHGLCDHCDFQVYCNNFNRNECNYVCDKIPFPHKECYTIFRFSQSITDKINGI